MTAGAQPDTIGPHPRERLRGGNSRKRKMFDIAALIAATGLTRFAFRSHYLYDIDSVNFALALNRFDPASHQPHPPGYFLYVLLGRLANLVFHDANAAFVSIGIVFSCATAAMIYALTDNWFGRGAALFAGLLFLFSPLAWFHGIVALTYIVEAFFSACVGYLCWQIHCGANRFILSTALVLGIAAGFRPSSILFLGPLFIFSLARAGSRNCAAGIGALIATILAWFIPMIRITGANAFISSLVSLWAAVPARESIFNSSPLNSLARAFVIAGVFVICFGCAAILPLSGTSRDRSGNPRQAQFTRIWLAPGLLFFTFVYLKFVNSGYLLILAPPVSAWMGLWGAQWYANPRLTRTWKVLLIASCATANTAIFIAAPLYCSYGEIRRFEAELSDIISVLPQIAPAGETVIVGLDSHFLGYRHAGYYLPGYLTIQFPEVRLAAGLSVFAMRDRDTDVTRGLPANPAMQNFVIFPLPSNDREYSAYMTALRGRLPSRDLRLISRGGHEFAMGPIRDLSYLFPAFTERTVAAVHAR